MRRNYSDKASLWGSTLHVTRSSVTHTIPVIKESELEKQLMEYLAIQINVFTSEELVMSLVCHDRKSGYSVGFKLEPKYDDVTQKDCSCVLPYIMCSLEEYAREKPETSREEMLFWASFPKYGHPSLIWVCQDRNENSDRKHLINFDFGFASWILTHMKPENMNFHETYSSVVQQHFWHRNDLSYWFTDDKEKRTELLHTFLSDYYVEIGKEMETMRQEIKRSEAQASERNARQTERDEVSHLKTRSRTPTSRTPRSQILTTLRSDQSRIDSLYLKG